MLFYMEAFFISQNNRIVSFISITGIETLGFPQVKGVGNLTVMSR